MKNFMKIAAPLGSAIAALTMATGVFADGMPRGGSVKDAPVADEGRKFGYSWNLGVTSDYIFRGISQNRRNPAVPGESHERFHPAPVTRLSR